LVLSPETTKILSEPPISKLFINYIFGAHCFTALLLVAVWLWLVLPR
jgi:hypothetical protein